MREWPSLVGKKFGRLEVKNQIASKRFECPSGAAVARYWNCLCLCGNYREVSTANLTSGEVKSCGCLFHPTGFHKRPYESTFNHLVASARIRNLSIKMTYDEFLCFTKVQSCAYCGALIKWNVGEKGTVRTNLDRKDNSKGYSKDNCVVCCGECNRIKSNVYTFEEFRFLMTALKKFRIGHLRGWKTVQIEVLRGD